jgi:asparagine synthase (glutamine-hydrolysing)
MPDPRYDESRFAEEVAAHLGAEHTTLDCDAQPASQLVSLIQQLGLPAGDSSLLPTHWVSAAARRHVKVALAGDGGDELFGGYERHTVHSLLRRWRHLLRAIPPAVSLGAHPKSRRSKLARLAEAARYGYPELLSIFGRADCEALFGPDARWMGPNQDTTDPLRWDFEHYLPDDLLRKTDTASMAVALEVRAPLLARHVINFALSQPLSALMPHNQRKGLLRSLARKYFPPEIVDRPKMGFAIPIGEWFRTDYGGLKTLLLDHLNSTEPWGSPSLGIDLNMNFVSKILEEHLGTGPSGLVRRDHSQRLYMLLVLSIWARWLSRV